MITLFARAALLAAILLSAALLLFGSHPLRIDTSLNDLNPENVTNPGVKSALAALSEDVSQRFVMVIKGSNHNEVATAKQALSEQLNNLPALSIISDDEIQANYLTALTPYRFNLLSDNQRMALKQTDTKQLATTAQRKLYQLGDGVRVIPFDKDPLGWFSEYILHSADKIRAGIADNPSGLNDRAVSSLTVSFSQYPSGMADQEQLYLAIKGIETAVSETYHVNVLHSGMFFFAVDSAASAKSDIQLIAIGSIVGILVLMLLVFRSLLPLLLSLSSIALGVLFGVLASTYLFGSVHILTIVFGASLIGIVVDYSLHYFYHFLSHQHDDKPHSQPGKTLYRAMLLSVLTSLIGYGALGLSDLLILKKVAVFSCSGLLMAWLSVIVLGPWVTRRPIDARQVMLRRIISLCQAVFARRPRVLVATGLAMTCAGAVFLYTGNVNTNDDPRQFFHVSPDLIAQEREVAASTQVYEPGRYLVIRGASSNSVFDALNLLYDELGSDHSALSSVRDWLPSPSMQSDNYALQAKLYRSGGVLDVFAQRLGLNASQTESVSSAYQEAKGKVLDFAGLTSQLPALPPLWIEQGDAIYSFALIKKNSDLDKIEKAANKIPGIDYVNTLANATRALQSQRQVGAERLLLAYLLIAALLTLYYRKLATVLLLLIPLSASVITLAAVALMGQAITVFHIMALFLVLGLGMDYIIFAKEMTSHRATTQQAILLSAVTSLLSFGLLAFSSMPIVQAFGSTILIGNTINFIAAISLFNGRQAKRENGPDVS